MKKRILALALAGTTAFSVFGAAMSASAGSLPSAQWVTSNDVYKEYTPVARTIDATYSGAVDGTTKVEQYYVFDIKGSLDGDDTTFNNPVVLEKDGAPIKTEKDKEAWLNDWIYQNEYTKVYDNGTLMILGDYTGYFYNGDWKYTATEPFAFIATAIGADAVYTQATADNAKAEHITYKNVSYFNNAADKAALLKAVASSTGYAEKYNHTEYIGTTDQLIEKAAYDKLYASKEVLGSMIQTQTSPVEGHSASGTVRVWTDADYAGTWTFNGSTSADTTVYPWTVTTAYTDSTGTVAINQAVPTPTVYLFDFIPANSTYASSAAIASASNAAVAAGEAYSKALAKYEKNATEANAKAVADAEAAYEKASAAAAAAIGNGAEWKAETGVGGSYGIRAEVVEDYEEFLSELILLKKGYYVEGGYTVSWTEFKDEYKDQFVSGYYYDRYTGLSTTEKWSTDLYNLSNLLDDIYESSLDQAYLKMNTSELLYLMQQYDKYVDYIEKAEVEKDEWGDLLVSILENVTEDDFKKAADYKAFARRAEGAIDAYDDAETSSMIKTAEKAMYDLITSEWTRSTGAADEKNALKSDIYSLYFNVKSTVNSSDYGYVTEYATFDNAVLTNYAYLKAVTKVKGDKLAVASDVLLTGAKTSVGYYTLYPQVDYTEAGNNVERYAGNTSAVYDGTATDEYEWFLNVYELANKVNSKGNAKSVSGIVSAVNDALNDAVAALEVTKPATATAESALDEMVEHYEDVLDFYVDGNGVNEEDFAATYYKAYEEALAYAEVAEGAYQVANARHMVEVAAEALTYNGAQVTVTKNDIKTLTAAITDGKNALKAIKDSKDYNAAQVTALNKAIDQAQDVVDIYNAKFSSSYNKVNKASAAYVGDKDGIVKSDITGAIDAINSAIDYSEIVMGWSKNDAGKWMYGTEDGYLNNGWNKIGSVWYYFNEDGTAKQSEWMQEDGKWYWFNSNAGAAIGWAKVDGQWYYFGGNNAMKTGWQKVDGSWYYLASSGRMITGWAQVDGKWYYMSKESNSLGQMLANTTTPDGYKVGADGAMLTK